MGIHSPIRRPHPELRPDEAERAGRDGALIVDVRENKEWDAARIRGAIHVPLAELERRLDELPRDRRLVAICRSGRRSAKATRILRQHGYDAANLAGGMQAWQRARLPIERPRGDAS